MALLDTLGETSDKLTKAAPALSSIFGAGQGLAGLAMRKKAQGMGPELVDPNQQAMANLTKRMLRANMTGTSTSTQQKQGAALSKMMAGKMTKAGGRSFAPILDLIVKNQAALAQTAGQERMSLLSALAKQTQDIADRKMDLQGLRQSKLEADAANLIKGGSENILGGLGIGVTGGK